MPITKEFVQICMKYLKVQEKIVVLHSRDVDPCHLNKVVTICNRLGVYPGTTNYERFTSKNGNGCIEDACKEYGRRFGGDIHIVGLRGKQGTPRLFYLNSHGVVVSYLV